MSSNLCCIIHKGFSNRFVNAHIHRDLLFIDNKRAITGLRWCVYPKRSQRGIRDIYITPGYYDFTPFIVAKKEIVFLKSSFDECWIILYNKLWCEWPVGRIWQSSQRSGKSGECITFRLRHFIRYDRKELLIRILLWSKHHCHFVSVS